MNTTFPSIVLGDMRVTAVSDGYLQVGFGLLTKIDEDECRNIQANARSAQPNTVNINTFLVQQAGMNILIDSGAGGVKGCGGQLINNLAKLGVKPEDIDAVLLTHAHPDHIGGLINSQQDAVFPRAELIIPQDEFSYLEDDRNLVTASERVKGNVMFARSVFKQYQHRLRLIDEGEVFAGISALALKGHTPGHTGYLLSGSIERVLVWGDIVHFPHIQLLDPEVTIAFDFDPLLAQETRIRLLEKVCAEQILVAGMHFDTAGFARIKKCSSGYQIIPADGINSQSHAAVDPEIRMPP